MPALPPCVPSLHPYLQRWTALGWTPSDCYPRAPLHLVLCFYFLPSSTLTSFSIPSAQPEPTSRPREALPAENPPFGCMLLATGQPSPVQNEAQPCRQEWSPAGMLDRGGGKAASLCTAADLPCKRPAGQVPPPPPRGQLLPPNTSKEGLAPGSGLFARRGSPTQHSRKEGDVPVPAALKLDPGIV